MLVGVEGQAAMLRADDPGGSQRVAVGIGVVAQHPGGGHGKRGVFAGGVGIIQGDRAVLAGSIMYADPEKLPASSKGAEDRSVPTTAIDHPNKSSAAASAAASLA